MSKINKVLYNVDQRDSNYGEPTTADERRMARKNLGLDEVVGQSATLQESGIAPLDTYGKVPAIHLPSYVDDIVDGYYYDGLFYEDAGHTTAIQGETGKIYVDITSGGDNTSYRYDGTHFVQISAQNTYSKVAFKGSGASSATTIASTQVSDTFQFTSGEGINLSQVGSSKELKIDVDFGSGKHGQSVIVGLSGTATVSDLSTSDPNASGNSLTFIDTISQDSKGKITATKKNVNVDSTYSASGTNPVNGTAVSKALEALDVNDISGLSDALAAKQDALTSGQNVSIGDVGGVLTISATDTTYTAGTNVSISGQNVISATDTTYSAGAGLNLDGTEFSVDTTTIATKSDLSAKQDTLTAGNNVRIDNNVISATDTTYTAGSGLALNGTVFSNAAPNVKSDWNASVGSDAFILNKPVVIEGQVKMQMVGTKQFKNLTIDNSGFAGTPATVSVTSTEDTTYTPGYLVTPAGSAHKYLSSGDGGVPGWDDLDMGSFEEYYVTPDGYEGVEKPLSKITVEKYENGNTRIKFNTDSSYKYLVPPPSPNRQLVANSSGVMQWDTINANISLHEIVLSERNGTQADSTIYNYLSDDLANGKTPMLWSGDNYGNRYFYIFKRRTGGSQSSSSTTFLFESNETYRNTIIRKLITDGTITTEVVPLQGRLTAGSGIAIDSDNTIMCTGSGQVVDGIYKNQTSGSTNATIQCLIDNTNTPTVQLIRSDEGKATYLNHKYVQSYEITPYADNTYTMFAVNPDDDTTPDDTDTSGTNTLYTRQLPTALGSVYSSVESLSRATLLGSETRSFGQANLGYLTVGTLAMRIINASDTSPSHQLLASCVKGEIDIINVNKNEELHTLTSDSASSYIGVAADDCMLMVTTKPRQYTDDAVARTKQAGDSKLGSIVMFPSKAYIDGQIANIDDIYLKQSFVSTAHVRLKTDTTYSNGNTSIMSTTLTVAGNGTGAYDLQPIASKADRNGLISITITSLSPGKKCIMSVIGRASGESEYNTLLRFGGESDTALELYSYSATIPVIYDWSTYGGSFKISINNKASSEVKYLIQVTAISGPCDYYP